MAVAVQGTQLAEVRGTQTAEARATKTSQDQRTATATVIATKTAQAPTATPTSTRTPRPTPTPTATIDADPTVYDNFNNPAFDGKWNTGLWSHGYDSNSSNMLIEQQNGILTMSRPVINNGGLDAINPRYQWKIDEIGYIEAKLMLDSNIQASEGDIGIGISGHNWWLNCSIYSKKDSGNSWAWANCSTSDNYSADGFTVDPNSWHTMRLEIDPDTANISLFVDGQQFGRYVSGDLNTFKESEFTIGLRAWSKDGGVVTGYLDDVKIGRVK